MGLKDNFYQALRELLNSGGSTGSGADEKAKSSSNLDSYNNASSNAIGHEFSDVAKQPSSATEEVKPSEGEGFSKVYQDTSVQRQASFSDKNAKRGQTGNWGNNSYKTERVSDGAPRSFIETDYGFSDNRGDLGGTAFKPTDEQTLISKNTIVDGNIRSYANVRIEGSVQGNVDVMKDAAIFGTLIGNLTCNNAEMQGSSIQGDVYTKGNSFIDSDSTLLGNITAQYASIDGKIKGDMKIGSKVQILQNAVVAGNIVTGTISVEDGANIKGFVNTAYLQEQGDKAFPSQVTVDDSGIKE